ncbi:MAG: chlorite dismutase family protein [Candidatus Calescibacterium sp.]|nr:chlorite dismutase family protein [Candidatus Calescibacterium sp.]MCX7972322.1 chlorite dismutase family protein [bacterium]MDW8195074.1 chlorite dismutase family protein [Candidatus Calescibacterium sp.]
MRIFSFYYISKLKEPKFSVLENFYIKLNSLEFSKKSVWLYQIFPLRTSDILVWLSFDFEDEDVLYSFSGRIANIFYSSGVELIDVLWGFTKPSIYTKDHKSTQEIDPFSDKRLKYLVVYPFVKTAEWYLLKQDTRQGMMNEHIRIGKKYPSILQLLLYSFGLSDQEFVVAYEMDSIVEFERLVYDLRSSEARKYTLRDNPIYTGIYRRLEDFRNILL